MKNFMDIFKKIGGLSPNRKVSIRPFNGIPITGSKLLIIGPGSEPSLLEKAIKAIEKK